MPTRISSRKLFAEAFDLRGDLGQRREIGDLVGGQVDAVNVKVLVAAGVLQVQHVLVVEGPEVGLHAALLFARHRFGGGRIVERADEHVEHAIAGAR